MLSIEKTIEYGQKHWHPVPSRPSGKAGPSCDLAPLVDLLYAPSDLAHGEGLVSIVARRMDGSMTNITTLRASRLKEFVALSLYLMGDKDYYITKASFRSPGNRCVDNVYSYDFIAVEVDCHNSDLSARDINARAGALIDVLRAGPVADGVIPDPNIVIYSGRGAHLIWLIDRVPAKAADVIKATATAYATIIEAEISNFPFFSCISVDRGYCNSPAGLMRLPGTTNTKNGADVTYDLIHTERMALSIDDRHHDKLYVNLGSRPSSSSSTTSRTGMARMRAIDALVNLRGGVCNGYRDQLTLIYFCSALMAGYSVDASQALALQLNARFIDPRPETEVIQSLSSASRSRYKFKDDTIFQTLSVTEAELEAIGWRRCNGHAPRGDKRTGGGHDKRDAARAAARQAEHDQVVSLHLEGKSISEIHRITGHHRQTISKWIAASEQDNITSSTTPDDPDSHTPDDKSSTDNTGCHQTIDGFQAAQKWARNNICLYWCGVISSSTENPCAIRNGHDPPKS